jgi:hypothetical protein
LLGRRRENLDASIRETGAFLKIGMTVETEITTEDGKKIALAADGVATAEEASPVFQLRENVTLTSNHRSSCG